VPIPKGKALYFSYGLAFKKRSVESPQSPKIAGEVEINGRNDLQTRCNTQIEIKREVTVIHAIDNTNPVQSRPNGVTLTKRNCHRSTTTYGYIKLSLVDLNSVIL
jgi:hypothetical protein